MSGFNFGTGTGTTAPALFGAKTTPSTGFSLGAGTTAPAPLFGATTSQPAGLTFGSPATTTTTGLSFGAAPNTGLSFGASAFGAPATSMAAPTTSMAAPATGLFGSTPATGSTGLTFGSTPNTQAGQAGLSFGQPATTATTQSGLSFGLPAASTAQTGLTFGTPAPATSAVGFSFGSSAQTAAITAATPSLSTGITFGAAPASIGTSLGLATTTTTAAKPLSLSFGTTPATSLPSSTQSTGFSLGTPGGLFGSVAKPLTLGQPSIGLTPSLNLGGATATSTTVASVGLGGVDASQTKMGQPGVASSKTDRAVKENQVPNEITQTIEGFKTFVKSQKSLSSDIARGSAKPLHKVQEDTESLRQMLTSIKSGLQRNKSLADRLKADTAKSIHDAEMAQRTHDTPPGLQYDNTAPLQYFSDLVTNFENEMQKFRQEIETAEKHLQSLCEPVALTPQELSLAMRHLHDSFVALAGRLQTVHNSVEAQKEQYLNLRKYFLKDSTNVFDEAKKTNANTMKPIAPTRISLGPTPFSPMGSQHRFGLLSAAPSETSSSFSAGKSLGWGGTQLQMPSGNVSSSYTGSLGSFSSSLPVDNQSFQLQKPPIGNKRGKR